MLPTYAFEFGRDVVFFFFSDVAGVKGGQVKESSLCFFFWSQGGVGSVVVLIDFISLVCGAFLCSAQWTTFR